MVLDTLQTLQDEKPRADHRYTIDTTGTRTTILRVGSPR